MSLLHNQADTKNSLGMIMHTRSNKTHKDFSFDRHKSIEETLEWNNDSIKYMVKIYLTMNVEKSKTPSWGKNQFTQ